MTISFVVALYRYDNIASDFWCYLYEDSLLFVWDDFYDDAEDEDKNKDRTTTTTTTAAGVALRITIPPAAT